MPLSRSLGWLLAFAAAGCAPALRDDDDAGDDDDVGDDDVGDDDAGDDDAGDDDVGDDDAGDDDATLDCDIDALAGVVPGLPQWTSVVSCQEAFVSVAPAAGTWRLVISLSLGGDPTFGPPFSVDLAAPPDPLVSGAVWLEQGTDLQGNDCVGVPSDPQPAVTASWTAAGGTVRLDSQDYSPGGFWSGTVQLSGVRVVDADGAVCALPDWSASGLGFGPPPP